VFHVLAAITHHGCDMFMDLHGDEKLPFNFLSGSEGVPRWQDGPRLRDLQSGFLKALMEVCVCVCVLCVSLGQCILIMCCLQASPDMQDDVKYAINEPCAANLSVASKVHSA
jgi:hypothetical protein